MDFRKTQIGCMLEQMKLAMLAHIPVIYIPTDQMELIHEILYSDNTIDSLVPRVKYDSEKKTVVKLADKEYGVKDDEKRTFSSIKDNYLIFVNSIDSDVVRCPSILLTYTTKWDKVETGIRNFISDYMGMKRSKDNNPNPYHVANISRSLCIVVIPDRTSDSREYCSLCDDRAGPALLMKRLRRSSLQNSMRKVWIYLY